MMLCNDFIVDLIDILKKYGLLPDCWEKAFMSFCYFTTVL